MITLSNVSKRYRGAEVPVLRGVDLSISAGEYVSIVGRSGSGKTTLLNLLGGLDSQFEGSVVVAGLDLCSLGDHEISSFRGRKVGFVFQNDCLLDHLSCRENVAVAALFDRTGGRFRPESIRRRADDLLAEVGLEGSGGRSSTTLSGGERQRVAFARALFNQPALLLCDEPTGNLDSATAGELVGLLERVHREHEMTIVAATHDEAISAAGERVLELSAGRLVERIGGGG